jgi:hypothetical protein
VPDFTITGCWPATGERFAEAYTDDTARHAEAQAQELARTEGDVLLVCRVLAGVHEPADRYTAYVDRGDPRNADRDGLEPDVPDLVAGDQPWTVCGFAVPASTAFGDPRIGDLAERYADLVYAASPGAAEDVAADRLKDKGGDLWVCGVFPGQPEAADHYARFADPDVIPA